MTPDQPHSDSSSPAAKDATRQRLIEAAGEVFADVGFRDATIRDICARAGANIAAVNYHFGDKERLYAQVIEDAYCSADHEYLQELRGDGLEPEKRLEIFVRGFIAKLLVGGRPSWHMKLISREMVDPTAQMNVIIDKHIRPQFEILREITIAVLGPAFKDDHQALNLCAASVVGQCLHYHHSRAVGTRLCPGMYDHPELVDELTAHVTRFSLHAMKGIRAERERGGA